MRVSRRAEVRGTGVRLTGLGFGAASIGNLYRAVADDQAADAVAAAWEVGIRYFDTAPHYGLGLSERRLGAALADRPREEFVLSTKVGRLLVPNEQPTGSDLAHEFDVPDDTRRQLDYSGPGVRRSIEESLTRLGLDRIDIALVHDPDDHVEQALAGALPELIRMREEGMLAAVGVGMNQWQAPLRFVRESDLDCVMIAGRWTLLDRSAKPLLDECHSRDVAILCAAPFNSGLLSKPMPQSDTHFDYSAPAAVMIERARILAQLALDHGVTLPDVAIQFPARHPAVATVVSGLARRDRVESAATMVAVDIPEQLWDDVESLVAQW